MSWPDRIALGGVLWGLSASIGFYVTGNWRLGTYYVLGAAITAVATWLL